MKLWRSGVIAALITLAPITVALVTFALVILALAPIAPASTALAAQCNAGSAEPLCEQTPIPSLITDGSLFDLEGDEPHPLVNPHVLEFVPLQAQVTTPNGNGWRHEYKIKQSLRVGMIDTYEEFTATITVDLSDGGKTIVAQHHASGTGTIMKLYVSDTSESGFFDSTPDNGIFDVYVRLRNTSGVEEKKPLGTIRSGDSFSFTVINDFGVVTVEAFGESLETEVENSNASYLKFGNYLQSQSPYGNVDCGESGDSDSFRDCYDELGITVAKVTMTDVHYRRLDRDAAPVAVDANCDGALNILDAFATASYVVGTRVGHASCGDFVAGEDSISLPAVHVDGEPVTILSAARVAQCVVEIPNALCPAAGDPAAIVD